MLVFVTERKIIKIKVTETADDVIEAFADNFDMKKQGVASRIYERFGQLPVPVQKWFIGLADGKESEGMQQFAAMLKRGEPPTAPLGEQSPVKALINRKRVEIAGGKTKEIG